MKKALLRPIFVALSLAVIGSVLLAACAPATNTGSGGSGGGSGGQVTIEYWDWWVTQGPTIDKEIKLFEQAHPNIKIKKTTQVVDKYPELLQLAMKSGNAPDVFLIPEKPKFIDQVKQGWLMPLNKWATKDWQAQFPPASFAEGDNVIDGKIYSAPYEGPAPWLQLYINTKLFKEAGLVDDKGEVKAPRTWDDVREDARIITKAGNGKFYGYGFGNKQKFILPWQLWMTQNSGAPDAGSGFDTREGKYTWGSNPVFADWIKFFMGMKEDGSIIPNAMSMDDEMARAGFADGKFAMLVGGVWNVSGWAKTNPNFKDYMIVQLPYEGPTQKSYFYRVPGGHGWAISGQSKHPEEAWLWFDWLNSKDAATRWVQAGQGLRVYPDVNKLEYAPTPQFAQYMKLATDDVKLAPAPSLKHPEMAEVKEQQTLPNIQNVLEGIYTGQIKDYKEALKDLESRQNAELQSAIKDAQDRGVKVDPSWWIVRDWNLTKDYAQ
ncbi:MAG: sugar ABC transporter substrate-binding protein [Chloroflexi bacterium]|nr:sugar ABC transporter substrate-binding protein [Chloroflexota bacterium]